MPPRAKVDHLALAAKYEKLAMDQDVIIKDTSKLKAD